MPHTNTTLCRATDLAKRIGTAGAEERLRLRPEFDKVLQLILKEGEAIPRRLRELNNELLDEAIEDQFDNLPV